MVYVCTLSTMVADGAGLCGTGVAGEAELLYSSSLKSASSADAVAVILQTLTTHELQSLWVVFACGGTFQSTPVEQSWLTLTCSCDGAI